MFHEGQTGFCESELNSVYSSIFSSLPVPVIVFEVTSYSIVDVNEEALTFYGYTRDEMLNLTMLDISIEADETRDSVNQAIDGNLSTIPIRYHRKKNGEILPVEIIPTVVSQNHQKLLCGIVKDISKSNMAGEGTNLSELRTSVSRSTSFGEIVGKSKAMSKVYDTLLKASMSDANVIIYGESGTGKEMAAKAIHELSDRKESPFIIVNCGAIPHDLLESEFFGYKRGAFTGATFDKPGYLASADGGTLFLDEVGDISKNMQVKLLRAIDGGGYTPLGSRDIRYPDIRIVSATNKDMKSLVTSGDIRDDFFYRIHVLSVLMPPLRHREGDITLLTHHFVQYYSNYTVFTIQPSLQRALEKYLWPGNVRELKNVVMRYIALKTDPADDVYNLDFLLEASSTISNDSNCMTPEQTDATHLKEAVEAFEKTHIKRLLDQHRWHQGKTAIALGIHQKTLARKMRRYDLV